MEEADNIVSKENLIEYIINNDSRYTRTLLDKYSVTSLVIIKVKIQLSKAERGKKEGVSNLL